MRIEENGQVRILCMWCEADHEDGELSSPCPEGDCVVSNPPFEPIWAGYIEQITDDQVWVTDDTLHVSLDRSLMDEKYGEAVVEGRMFVTINGEFYWRFTRWTADEIAAIKEKADELASYFLTEEGEDGTHGG